MAVLVALTVGLVWWITAWAFGIKAFDAFLLTAALVVGAAAWQIVKPYLDRARRCAAPDHAGLRVGRAAPSFLRPQASAEERDGDVVLGLAARSGARRRPR